MSMIHCFGFLGQNKCLVFLNKLSHDPILSLSLMDLSAILMQNNHGLELDDLDVARASIGTQNTESPLRCLRRTQRGQPRTSVEGQQMHSERSGRTARERFVNPTGAWNRNVL